jgi:hypothetical protein
MLESEIKDLQHNNGVLKDSNAEMIHHITFLYNEIKDLKNQIMILKQVDSTIPQPLQGKYYCCYIL